MRELASHRSVMAINGFAGYEPKCNAERAVITTNSLMGYFGSLRITADLKPGGYIEAAVVDKLRLSVHCSHSLLDRAEAQ